MFPKIKSGAPLKGLPEIMKKNFTLSAVFPAADLRWS